MRRTQFSKEQVIVILREVEAGVKTSDPVRRHGISEGTLHRWKAKYGGLTVRESRRLTQLEDEKRRVLIN